MFTPVGLERRRESVYSPLGIMHYLLQGLGRIGGPLRWRTMTLRPVPRWMRGDDSVTVEFSLFGRVRPKDALARVEDDLANNEQSWLVHQGRTWRVNLTTLRSILGECQAVDWLDGEYHLKPDIDVERNDYTFPDIVPGPDGIELISRSQFRETTFVRFVITREDVIMSRHRKVFLSHKGVNKPKVREFAKTLRALGFDPWLDEDAMHAGTELERALLKGMQESCAAVFFITPDFQDEKYLATEVDYAIGEVRKRPEQFHIIPLLLKDKNGKQGVVPDLLQKYKWADPKSDLEALRAILDALPLVTGPVDWRE